MSQKIFIQSESLNACCEAEKWDYDEELKSFEFFYQSNKSKIKGGARKALATWYRLRKENKTI